MDKKTNDVNIQEEVLQENESIKFGYGASIVFLIFIGFVIYVSYTS